MQKRILRGQEPNHPSHIVPLSEWNLIKKVSKVYFSRLIVESQALEVLGEEPSTAAESRPDQITRILYWNVS